MTKLSEDRQTNFCNEIINARNYIVRNTCKNDIFQHFANILFWQNLLFIIGICGIWIKYNFISIFSLTCFIVSRWTINGHHICHGGYDRCNQYPYIRKDFGKGFRRIIDWFDWFSIEAWKFEHNKFHHYYLNESADPDLVENIHDKLLKNFTFLLKNIAFILSVLTWRWSYYASNTLDKYNAELSNNKSNSTIMIHHLFYKKDLLIEFVKIVLPYFMYMFICIPSIFGLIFGSAYFYNTLYNLILTEFFANIYSFSIIASNHCGKDLYRFNKSDVSENGRIYRAALGSVNFPLGNDIIDFSHGYLNYQIEHHMFPNLSCLEYKKLAPKVEEICKKYDVQYIKQNIFIRLYYTYRIFVGLDKMKVYD
jgi:fatty acid desaturase